MVLYVEVLDGQLQTGHSPEAALWKERGRGCCRREAWTKHGIISKIIFTSLLVV